MTERRPATEDDLFRVLGGLGIETRTVDHPPAFTVEEAKAHRGDLPGGHCKNLFLRDKKKNSYLVVCLEDTPIDLKALGPTVGAQGRLTFGSADRLMEILGVAPGSVTPFAVLNDADRAVTVVLEAAMLEQTPLNYHPLRNDRTTAITPTDLMRFLEAIHGKPEIRRI